MITIKQSKKSKSSFVSFSKPAFLQEGWVIANHILVSFHVAFISSVLALPPSEILRGEVLKFIFLSPETLISAIFVLISFHTGIALHEIGHYMTAAKLNALNDSSQQTAERLLRSSLVGRVFGIIKIFLLAPYGKAVGIKREGLNYYPDAPYNLAVAAAGPRMSRNVALITLPPAILLLAVGLLFDAHVAVYVGRLLLALGIVGTLDFFLADAGKYREFKQREQRAEKKAAGVEKGSAWMQTAAVAKDKMLTSRMQKITHPRLGPVTAPWQFRNCGMGGRHTEKEYPESNVSMQEAMFLILGAGDYQEAQEMTVRLQNRLKEIIEKAEGCRVMGIGLEGGLAPYIERGDYPLPEVRLWAMMKQTIQECGYRPGVDVAIALDPAMAELEIAYRKHFKIPDAVGMYLFWRDKALNVLDRGGVLDIYVKAIEEYDIPILSIEDGFSEEDFEGWQNLLNTLGDRIFVIGDDLVTTNDATIELASSQGLINTALIKANQIGSLFETILAMLVALGKGMDLVVSHRSKSPNDDMEAQIALSVNSLGLKAGGGANTERLVKYQGVNELMQRGASEEERGGLMPDQQALITRMYAYEEPTNAGIPTVGAITELSLPDSGIHLKFSGATPLGTSAGTGEAIHLVDSVFESAEYREVIEQYSSLFREVESNVFAFNKEVGDSEIEEINDDALHTLFARSQRYEGKGCLNAADNVRNFIGPAFIGRSTTDLTMKEIDRILLSLELQLAQRRGKTAADAGEEERIKVMQRKQNLGMNAMLSISLALARAVAHLQGKDLYEILREEMYAIIEQLARDNGATIEGSSFADYVAALREVNQILEKQGKSLHEVLRKNTGIYVEADTVPAVPLAPAGVTAKDTSHKRAPEQTATASKTAQVDRSTAPVADPVRRSSPKSESLQPEADEEMETASAVVTQNGEVLLTVEEANQISEISGMLYSAFRDKMDRVARHRALYHYQMFRQNIVHRLGRFGIVNNRVFLGDGILFVPYLACDTLFILAVSDTTTQMVYKESTPVGSIFTDDLLRCNGGVEGTAIDLEHELSALRHEEVEMVRVERIRDMVEQLQRINHSVNRNEAVFVLRSLVARLSLFSFKQYLSAKNIQSEVHNVIHELTRFLNMMMSNRRPFLVRMLIRNITSIISKPMLIDRLWNDTIDLAEIHIRGSAIVNELRRSSHHAIGRHTLALAQAYLSYLDTGDTQELGKLGYTDIGAADEEARNREHPKQIITRVVGDLEDLLGNSETVSRISEWRSDYEATLVRCEFGRDLSDEIAAATEGIQSQNKWTYYHHLRIIKRRVAEFAPDLAAASELLNHLDALLELKPGEASFDANATESNLRKYIETFVESVKNTYQKNLFEELEGLLESYQRNEFYNTFTSTSRFRKRLRRMLEQRAFPEQRLLLYQLDCLLEEMGYLALRHVASEYDEQGVDLAQCLKIIHTCVLNLTHDGLYSRQLRDLADILLNPEKTYTEIVNVLGQIQRNYQHIVQRVITPFEKMQERLGFDDAELRIAMANMQRYMHDLNSIAYFIDMALTHIKHNIDDMSACIVGLPPVPAAAPDPFSILHLSHRDEIEERIENSSAAYNLREHYGGKGSGLLYISYLTLPTRDGFIIPASMARSGLHKENDARLSDEISAHLRILEKDIERRNGDGKSFADPKRPLLLAVRGGSVFSMPGMLSTVLFVGMNDEIAEGLADKDPWCAYDSYRRFLASYGAALWGINMENYNLVDETKMQYGVQNKEDLPWEGMKEIAEKTKNVLAQEGYKDELDELLCDPYKQLTTAVQGVFDSWNSEGARRYRELKSICESWQTAVIVQEMALGNRKNDEIREGMDETKASLTGVIPRTRFNDLGVRILTGDFKFSAQGDDLVGGLTHATSFNPVDELPLYMPMLNRRLSHSIGELRRFMGTDQEIEFTVEGGVLSILQSRAAEIGSNKRVTSFEDLSGEIASGIGVRGSAFRGLVAFDEADLKELAKEDLSNRDDIDGVLIVIENPSPEDIPLILMADGLMAAKGGSTSHAAIAVNGIERRDYYGVVGVEGLRVDPSKGEAEFVDSSGNVVARVGRRDVISIHGTRGTVYIGSRQLKSQ
jgi:enolase/phosphoenolpyruvate synthase/pyruvate phosphate dikinase